MAVICVAAAEEFELEFELETLLRCKGAWSRSEVCASPVYVALGILD